MFLFLQQPSLNKTWFGNICNVNLTLWNGVTCKSGHVTALNLTYSVVGGVVPPPIYMLPKLTSFICIDCNLTGKATFPPT